MGDATATTRIPIIYLCEATHAIAAVEYVPTLAAALSPCIAATLVSDRESVLTGVMRRLGHPVHIATRGNDAPTMLNGVLEECAASMPDAGVPIAHAFSSRAARWAAAAAQRPATLWQLLPQTPASRRGRATRSSVDLCLSSLAATLQQSNVSTTASQTRIVPTGAPRRAFEGALPERFRPGVVPTVGIVVSESSPNPGQRLFFGAAGRLSEHGMHANWVVHTEPDTPEGDACSHSEERQRFLDELDVLVVSAPRTDDALVTHAMARGLPIVASATPGMEELIETGVTGWLVPPRDAVAIYRATSFLLRNTSQAIALGGRAHRAALEKHRSEDHVDAIHNIYRELRGDTPAGKHQEAAAQRTSATTSAADEAPSAVSTDENEPVSA